MGILVLEVQRPQSLICIQASSQLSPRSSGLGEQQPYITCTLCQPLHCPAGSSPARTPHKFPAPQLGDTAGSTTANKGKQQKGGWPPHSAPTGLPSTVSYLLCFRTCCQRRRRSRRRRRRGCHTCRWGRWTWRGQGG